MNCSKTVVFAAIAVLLPFVNVSNAQQCASAPLAGNLCSDAPLLSCNLDGYTGSTAGFTPTAVPNGFCGIIENNQFLSFVADASPVILKITPSACADAKGIQANIYETNDCVTLSSISNCASFGYEATLTVTAPVVTIGKKYYLMIDGYEGDICDYTIQVVSGIFSDVVATATDAQLCPGSSIVLQSNVQSETDNLLYEWQSSQGGQIIAGINTPTPTVNALGEYTLTVTDTSTCCVAQTTLQVTESQDFPYATVQTYDTITCTQTQALLDGTGSDDENVTYQWSTTNGLLQGNTQQLQAHAHAPGQYTLQVTNVATGCSSIASVNVTADTTLPQVINLVSSDINCTHDTVHLMTSTASPTTTIQWEGPNGFAANGLQTSTSTAGVYTLTATADNGCTQNMEVTVNIDTLAPDIQLLPTDTLTCNTTSVEIQTLSNQTVAYNWTGPQGFTSTNNNPDVSVAGSYELLVTGLNGCTNTASLEVQENKHTAEVEISVPAPLTCSQQHTTLSGIVSDTTDFYTFEWLNANHVFLENTPTLDVYAPGTYQLLVTHNETGCTASASTQVIENTNPPTIQPLTADTLTCATPIVLLQYEDTPSHTYQWLDNQANIIASDTSIGVSEAATYTLLVTDIQTHCTASTTVEVTENTSFPAVNMSENMVLDCANTEVLLALDELPEGTFSYVWHDEQGETLAHTPSITVQEAGSYRLHITNDENGCQKQVQTEVLENQNKPDVQLQDTAFITCTHPFVTIHPVIQTQSGAMQTLWSNNNGQTRTSTEMSVSEAGLWTLSVTDPQNGCETSQVINVVEDTNPPQASLAPPTPLTCTDTVSHLSLAPHTVPTSYQWVWEDATGTVLTTEAIHPVTDSGTYYLKLTDTLNGCQNTQAIVVNQNTMPPSAAPVSEVTLNCQTPSLLLDIGTSSTGQNIRYTWKNEAEEILAETDTLAVSSEGNYLLYVTNTDNGCTDEASVNVIADTDAPTAEAGSTQVLTCTNEVVSLDGSLSSGGDNLLFTWNNPSATTISTTAWATALSSGVYELTVQNTDNGCSDTDTVHVLLDTIAPLVEIVPPDVLNCYTESTEILVTPNQNTSSYQYQWLDAAQNTLTTHPALEVSHAGTYTLRATNPTNGCVAEKTVSVTADTQQPEVIAGIGDTLTCANTNVLLSGSTNLSSDFRATWTNTQGQLLSQTLQTSTSEAGNYLLEITNVENGCSNTDVVTIAVDTLAPTARILTIDSVLTCLVTSIELDGSTSFGKNPLLFAWKQEDNTTIPLASQAQLHIEAPGTYILQVTDTYNGCMHEHTIHISENKQAPQAIIAPPDILTCRDTTVQLLGTTLENGDFNYQWTTHNGHIIQGATTNTTLVSQSGEYTWTATDNNNGCADTVQVQVLENTTAPTAAAQVFEELDCVTETVQLSGQGSSEGTSFTYQWSGNGLLAGVHTLSPTVGQAGLYQLFVENTENGCTDTAAITVMENTQRPTGALLDILHPRCHGDNNGVIALDDIEGGTPPYLYAFEGPSFSPQDTYTNLSEGIYTFQVQDAIGCEWDTTLQLTAPRPVEVELGEDIFVNLGETITVSPQSISTDITQTQWFADGNEPLGNAPQLLLAPTQTTVLELTVANENGCSETDFITIFVQKDRNVFIPNVFSPNGDGVNDRFQIYVGDDVATIDQLTIFDRWGEQLFIEKNINPNDPAHGWDGTYRQQKMQPGVYVYYAEITFIDGKTELFKGDITIYN